MQALTNEQIKAIIRGEILFIHDVFYECEEIVNEAIESGVFPKKILIKEVNHKEKTQYILSLEVRNDLNEQKYPEVVMVEATSGTLCGSAWARYDIRMEYLDDFIQEVSSFVEEVVDWIHDNIEWVENNNSPFNKVEEQAFALLGY